MDHLPHRQRAPLVWSVAVVAVVAFLCTGLAERGGRGARLDVVPQAPLPFPRHEVMGVDLRGYSSLEALQWLQTAGSEPFALVALAVDPDIVRALGTPEQESAAILAMDQLVQAASSSPIAVCLWNPLDAVDLETAAQAATVALIERYPDRIAYVSGCASDDDSEWHRAVDASTDPGAELVSPSPASFVPLSSGARLNESTLDSSDDLNQGEAVSRTRGSPRYTILSVRLNTVPDPDFIARANSVVEEVATVGLVLAAPAKGDDPAAFGSAVRSAGLGGSLLAHGFSIVTAPGISAAGDWNVPMVGTVRYARTSSSDAAMSAEFVGTEVYVHGLASPDGGRLLAWIDPDPGDPTAPPDVELDFSADQAEDIAIPIKTDLPADRHRLVVLAQPDAGETVSISGFVVTGSVVPRWTTRMAAAGFLALAVAAIAERSYSGIQAVRGQGSRPSPRRPSRHPRVFNRVR